LTDAYVCGVLLLSVWIYSVPSVCLASLSTYFSASTVIVLMNIVLLQGLFGKILSPERSLLLFMCNVAQVTVMFTTWYRLGGYSGTEALLKSILTFATIDYAEKMPLRCYGSNRDGLPAVSNLPKLLGRSVWT